MNGLLPDRKEITPILGRLVGFGVLSYAALVGMVLLTGAPESVASQGSVQLVAGLVATLVILRVDGKRGLSTIGLPLRGAVRGVAGGMLLGIVVIVAVLAIAVGAGGLRYAGDEGTLVEYGAMALWTALVLLVAGTGEEVLVRGYPFTVLLDRWGPGAALVLTSLVFTVLHGANPHVGALGLLNIGLAGLFLGLVRLRTGSLWWASGVHAGWNFGTGFLSDLPVSGLDIVDAPLVEVSGGGTAVITGGEFGLEGGVAATVGLVLAILLANRMEASGNSGAGAA